MILFYLFYPFVISFLLQYYDFDMSDPSPETKKSNVTAKLESLNILPEKANVDEVCDHVTLSIFIT